MNILVVGGGGREHAIAWKLAQEGAGRIWCAPGNAGTARLARRVDIKATEIERLAEFARQNAIDLTVVGMDDPLMLGVCDLFEQRGLRIFGPRKAAALIEGSKVFAKNLMSKYNIPTAGYKVLQDPSSAREYLRDAGYPVVLKADGLAAGKGVLICQDYLEADKAVRDLMELKKFGGAGASVVAEEFLTGREVSVLAFCDGKTVAPMLSARDFKRARDGGQGLNTGGMGCIAPCEYYTPEIHEYCVKRIYEPTAAALNKEGIKFVGVLYFGLMLTASQPYVLEYNARFGDPEAQVVLPMLKSNLLDIFQACLDGTLDKVNIEWRDGAAVCVVAASDGYPEAFETGFEIKNITPDSETAVTFHAGTTARDGRLVTSGGRVLGVTGLGADLETARARAYAVVNKVDFANKYFRSDII
ncbi:MAG: phosphoribosylamine--glycine ligase [Clostridiales bacterium]|jgi:phosphoribosylamine--glycine ligase|nr:phosphoribosylamine--glycine ligase [Clostridiales bacterium]